MVNTSSSYLNSLFPIKLKYLDDSMSQMIDANQSSSPLKKSMSRKSGGSQLKSFKTFIEKTSPNKIDFKFMHNENYIHRVMNSAR